MNDPRELALGLYDDVLQGKPLDGALGRIATALGAQTGFITRLPMQHGRPAAAMDFTRHRIRAEPMEDYSAHWMHLDPRVGVVDWGREGVYNFARLLPRHRFEESAFWREWGRQMEPCFHTVNVIVAEKDDVVAALALHRPPDAEPFDDQDEAFLTALYPHLRQALLAQSRLAGIERQADLREAGLDAVPQGVAVFDAAGGMRHANRVLEKMAAQRDGLALGPEGLLPSDATALANARYALRLALAVAEGRIRLLPDGMHFAIPRPSGRSPFLVQTVPRRDGANGRAAGAVMVVTDTAARRLPSALTLQRVLGLTPAEADLAAALAGGRTLAQQALKRQVSRETLKTHLATIRRKTGCRRQSDLVALVLRLGD
ncbi:helix-turn-helix transcriptional regulator [Pseudoroseomonas globiformis]|uniref:Helix-turn-helix transcriptional regulator n=1 Tax=Teichococcus globiformis TaxID=2307229 RepID=A0ABV7G752_9PROT